MTDEPIWTKDETIEFVSLTSGSQEYCIDIRKIREIRRWTSVTPLPRAEPSVLGVLNLRGAVIPIIDLASKLGLKDTEYTERSVVVVVAIGTRVIGLLVDAVSEILSVKGETIRPNPTMKKDGTVNHIIGLLSVEDSMLRVLDLDSLFASQTEEAA